MGREAFLKDIRKQLRNISKEQLPEIMQTEFAKAVAKEVMQFADTKLTVIAKSVESALAEMNERSKDMQSYVLRNTTPTAVAPVPPIASDEPKV